MRTGERQEERERDSQRRTYIERCGEIEIKGDIERQKDIEGYGEKQGKKKGDIGRERRKMKRDGKRCREIETERWGVRNGERDEQNRG